MHKMAEIVKMRFLSCQIFNATKCSLLLLFCGVSKTCNWERASLYAVQQNSKTFEMEAKRL